MQETRGSLYVALAILIATIAFSLGGWAFGFYGNVSWYDRAAHVLVPLGIATVIAVLLDRRTADTPVGPVLRFILVVCATLTIALIWEIGEWVYDLAVAGNPILGKRDTMIDFLCGAAGAIVGALIGFALAPHRRVEAAHA